MSVAGVANDLRGLRLPAVGLALLLAGCAGTAPWPFNSGQVVARAPEPPQILSASHRPDLPPCPQQLIMQAQWLARNMARVRLGYNKLQVVSVLGDPANSETFSLSNGAVVEVLFYHTPETICRVSARDEGLMPLVFQDDRLLGYGPNYYRGFIAPMVRPNAVAGRGYAPAEAGYSGEGGMPQGRVNMTPAPALQAAPARRGRLLQEDLPQQQATPPATIYAPPPVMRDGNGYTAPMNDMQPNGYYATDSAQPSAVGRGAPLQ